MAITKELDRVVSRETKLKIEAYINLILKWNSKINLVSKNSDYDSLLNHVMDCLDLLNKLKEKQPKCLLDIGSGAGFPGMILAIAGINNITLVESDTRKATFLEYVKNHLKVEVEVANCRVEKIADKVADVIVSRAMTSASELIKLCNKLIDVNTKILLMKSNTQLDELKELARDWNFELQIHSNDYINNHVVFEIWHLIKK